VPHRSFHRVIFAAAGVYNLSWGLYSALDPQWLFRFLSLAPGSHPEIFACLGMVIGLYGILYIDVARAPERGWLIVAVGLAGKILGPIGALILVWNGTWPARSLLLCLTNDFIWWVPFSMYLGAALRPGRSVLVS
jgi:hypothetical protein